MTKSTTQTLELRSLSPSSDPTQFKIGEEIMLAEAFYQPALFINGKRRFRVASVSANEIILINRTGGLGIIEEHIYRKNQGQLEIYSHKAIQENERSFDKYNNILKA